MKLWLFVVTPLADVMLPARTRDSKPVRTFVVVALAAVLTLVLGCLVAARLMPVDLGSVFLGALFVAVGAVGAWMIVRRTAAGPRENWADLVYRNILTHPNRAILSTDANGVITAFSHGAERLFGHAVDAVTQRLALTALVDAESLDETTDAGRRGAITLDSLLGPARGADGHAERDCVCRRADGRTFPARMILTALRDGDGVIAGYLAGFTDITEARRLEARRSEFDRRMTKIAAQVPGMVFQFKQLADGRRSFPYASEGIREIFGVEPAAVASDSKQLWDIVHPDDAGVLARTIEHSARTLGRWECEFRIRSSNGVVRWLWGTALPERQPDGTVVWHGFITNITQRKEVERAHEENRIVLESILASVDLGVFLVDVLPNGDFRFVEVNPAYERLTGISAAEIRGRTPRELVPVIPAEMAACLRASLRRGADATGPVEYEEPFFVRGRLLWWLTRLTPLRDASGKVVRIVGRSLDITERKTAELRFQTLTERLQLATEAAQVGIWDFDVAQNKLVWDAQMLALYGLNAMTFDGTLGGWRERVHPADRTRAEQEYREAIDARKPYTTSFRIVRPDGEEREIRARAHVQRNPAGRAMRVVGVHWDVTAERRAQAEIENARDQAEDLNRQLEDALERAHRLAQEAAAATVAKSEFLANMSHEIRTPLNAIIGMGGLLLGTELTKEQREFAETIRSSGDGLLGLVNDILDYSKIESGRLDLEHRAFDLRQCIESSLDVLAARAAEKKLDLLHAMGAGVPESIEGDVTRLRQIIVNLLSNAVKFTAHGEVLLSVDALPAQDAGRVRLRFSVHDSGIGIPADRMDRLFKTFSQVDASTTRQFGGTGLGLAISKRIVELMGGRIWVESVAGKGSTFSFEIEAPPATAPAKPFATGRVPAFVGRRLLLVDDNATSCRVICQQAVVWGMMPRAVATAAEARQVLQQGERFDVMLIDADLAGASGFELARAIRTTHPPATLPLALITAPGQTRPGPELGLAGCINKPVKMGALFDLLREALQGRTAPRQAGVDTPVAMAEDRPLRILLAEDNPVNQRVAILMLQRLGYRADVAVNGREAVAAAERQRYDLILMDVQMPEMDGLQASREICARLKPERRPRIVAMTANASTGDRDLCLSVGMSDFLSKPVRAEDLRKALEDTPVRAVAATV